MSFDLNTCRLCTRLKTPNCWPVLDIESWHVFQQIFLQRALLDGQEGTLMKRKDLMSAHSTSIGAMRFRCVISWLKSENYYQLLLFAFSYTEGFCGTRSDGRHDVFNFSDKKVNFVDSCRALHNQNPVSRMSDDWSLRLLSFDCVWMKKSRQLSWECFRDDFLLSLQKCLQKSFKIF